MAIQLYSANALAAMQGVKVLTYGRAGMGKTALCATAPAPVVISAEAGLLSLRRSNIERMFGVNTPGISYEIPVIPINNLQDLVDAEIWCRTSIEAQQFQTVCIDSLTEVAEKVLANAKLQVKDPRKAYLELIEQMEKTIKSFRDLQGKHVYMSAKEDKMKDDVSGGILNGPAMPGSKLGPAVSYLFDEVFQIGINKNPDGTSYRYLKTQPDFNSEGKDRSGALEEIEFPHLGNVFNKILTETVQLAPQAQPITHQV
jgi:hypothetical protein